MIEDREGPNSPPCLFQGDGLARRNTISYDPDTPAVPGILAPMIVTDFGEDDHPPALPAARTLERFIATAAKAIPLPGDLSVLITNNQGIRRLNRRYRGKNKPTDVLSFPAGPEAAAAIAGDIAISFDMAARQALVLEHTLAVELKILILHGMLHLSGLDHEKDKGEMAARETALRRKLRLPGGLIERTQGEPITGRSPARTKRARPMKKTKPVSRQRAKAAR